MKTPSKNVVQRLVLIFSSLLVSFVSASCGDKGVVGEWVEYSDDGMWEGEERMEFFKDGTGVADGNGERMTFEWSVFEGGSVKMDVQTEIGSLVAFATMDAGKLQVAVAGESLGTYVRVGSDEAKKLESGE